MTRGQKVIVVYMHMCYNQIYIYIYIYVLINSDVVLRHGPHLKICIIYFRIVIYFDYAYAFPG